MKRLLTILTISVCANFSYGQTWTTITTDPANDAAIPDYLDGTLFEYWYDQVNDSIWFRITVLANPPSVQATFGVNIMLNLPGGGNPFNFWGVDNNTATYNRMVTAWVSGTPPSNYSGTIGVADAAGVFSASYMNLSSNNLTIISTNPPAPDMPNIVIGMLRSDLIPTSAMGQPLLTAAAVGTAQFWNDDLYSPTGMMTIQSTVGIEEEDDQQITVYPNPTNSILNIGSTDADLQIEEVSITDVAGRLVMSAYSESIDVSSLTPGMYFLTVKGKDEKQIATSKFFKE